MTATTKEKGDSKMMKFSIGDKIIWVKYMGDPSLLQEGTITKLRQTDRGESLVFVDNQHKPEDSIYHSYCWPARVKDELLAVLAEQRRLQKAGDDSIELVYQLRNAIARGEK